MDRCTAPKKLWGVIKVQNGSIQMQDLEHTIIIKVHIVLCNLQFFYGLNFGYQRFVITLFVKKLWLFYYLSGSLITHFLLYQL